MDVQIPVNLRKQIEENVRFAFRLPKKVTSTGEKSVTIITPYNDEGFKAVACINFATGDGIPTMSSNRHPTMYEALDDLLKLSGKTLDDMVGDISPHEFWVTLNNLYLNGAYLGDSEVEVQERKEYLWATIAKHKNDW